MRGYCREGLRGGASWNTLLPPTMNIVRPGPSANGVGAARCVRVFQTVGWTERGATLPGIVEPHAGAWRAAITGGNGHGRAPWVRARLHVLLGWLTLVLAIASASGAEPKRVLLIHSFGRNFPPFNTLSAILQTELVSQSPEPLDLCEVSLESGRLPDTAQEGPLVDYLRALFSGRRLDLVVPIGGPAARFAQRHRQALFPGTPMLIAATDERLVQQTALTTQDTVVPVRNDLPRMFQTILDLLPQTTNIAVVIGKSPLEKFWLGEIQRASQRFTNQVGFLWLNELSFAETLERCAALPPCSAIFYPLLVTDAEGVPRSEEDVLPRLRDVGSAPLFGLHETQLGRGIVGGPLMGIAELSRNTARVAMRILAGEAPDSIRPSPQEPGSPQFDWRELRRWGISEARLPAGSVVRFRQPGFWRRYWWLVCAGALFGAVEAALIVGLLINRARRRQGEAVATLTADLSSRLINLPPGEVDRAIEEAQRRVCECLGLDISTLWQWAPDESETLIMTHIYRRLPGPATPERFEAQEHFPWALRQLKAGRVVALSMNRVPAEAARDLEAWRHFRLKTVLHLPLSVGGGPPIGLLAFNDTRTDREWTPTLVQRLQLVAQVFANALARKHADHELHASERRYRTLHESMREAFVSVEMTGRLQEFNAVFKRMLGYSDEELRRLTYPDLTPERWHTMEAGIIRDQVLARGYSDVYEKEYRRKDQTVFPVELRTFLIRDESGRPVAMWAIVRDITERKQDQEALREFSVRLIRTQEEERSRLARELHDDITQRLARLAIDVGRAEMGTAGAPSAEAARSVREELIRLSEDVHALSYRLHPSIIEDLGIAAAIKAEAERVERQGPIPVNVTVQDIPESVASQPALCVFRVVQEALRNTVRHARARVVKISLRGLDGGLQLAVQDDGCGFDPVAQRDRPSLGLASMRERVHLIGGEFDVESALGRGTTIVAWVPTENAKSQGLKAR